MTTINIRIKTYIKHVHFMTMTRIILGIKNCHSCHIHRHVLCMIGKFEMFKLQQCYNCAYNVVSPKYKLIQCSIAT